MGNSSSICADKNAVRVENGGKYVKKGYVLQNVLCHVHLKGVLQTVE